MGRAGGAGEVRLPRPEDADRARRRGKAAQAARHPGRSADAAARRRADLPDAGARRRGRRVPGGKPGHAARADRHAARPLRGHHRAGGALSPGPDGQHPDLLRAQARRRGAGISASDPGADPEGDVRRHHLPGTGDADRAGDGRLFARRSRPAAPRDGQEDPRRDGKAARALRRRRGQERRAEGAGRHDLRPARQIRRLRLQQEPRRGLRAGVLPHRLYEGALPGGVPGGVDDARNQQHRQARRNFAPRRCGSASRSRRRTSTVRPPPSRSARTRSTMRSPR